MRHASTSANDTAALVAASVLLVVAMVFGGGPRGMGDLVVHVAMLPCLAFAILRWRAHEATRLQRWFLAWWWLALAVIALQLVPLPPGLLRAMPERASVLADLAQAGAPAAWHPMTLDGWATLRALLAVATVGTAWMLAVTLSADAQRRVLMICLATATVLALFGFAQAAGGAHAPRFHPYHHNAGALGGFANRNHFAALLAMCLPIALAFAAQAQRDGKRGNAAIAFGVAALLWLAAALTYSRAGFLLASLSLVVSSLVLWWPRGEGVRAWRAPLLVAGATLLAVGHYAWDGLVKRLEQDPLDDARWDYVRNGMRAFHDFLPLGSGMGSFPWVNAPYETVTELSPVFAERAHNDLLQVGIEAGVPGLVLVALFIAFMFVVVVRNFPMGRAGRSPDHAIRSVIAVALAVPLLHSLVDYPLRTYAVAVLAGLLLAAGMRRDRHARA